jgi:hypothetical protein
MHHVAYLGKEKFGEEGIFQAQGRTQRPFQGIAGRLPDPPDHVQPVLPSRIQNLKCSLWREIGEQTYFTSQEKLERIPDRTVPVVPVR